MMTCTILLFIWSKSIRELPCLVDKIDEWGHYIGEWGKRVSIKKAEAQCPGFFNKVKSLEIESQFGKHPQAIVAHLYGVEGPSGFTVTPGGLSRVGDYCLIGVDVEDIIHSGIPGNTFPNFIRQVDIGGYFGMEDEVLRHH